MGHEMQRYDDAGSVICAIAKNQTGIFANADYRKAGEVVGLWLIISNANQIESNQINHTDSKII